MGLVCVFRVMQSDFDRGHNSLSSSVFTTYMQLFELDDSFTIYSTGVAGVQSTRGTAHIKNCFCGQTILLLV